MKKWIIKEGSPRAGIPDQRRFEDGVSIIEEMDEEPAKPRAQLRDDRVQDDGRKNGEIGSKCCELGKERCKHGVW